MKYIKLVHTADLHLGSNFGKTPGIAAERREEQLENLRNIVDICHEREANVLLIAGDLFDTVRIDEQLLMEVQNIMEDSGLEIFISPGNHDPATPDSSYMDEGWPENVHIFTGNLECYELPDTDVLIWGLGFRHPVEPECLLGDVQLKENKINILVMHTEIVAGSSTESRYNPVQAEKLNALGFDYCAIGHSHKATTTAGGEYTCLYCGCPFGRGFDEQGDKGVIVGQVGKDYAHMEYVSCGERRYYSEKIDVTGCEVTSDYVEVISETLSKLYGEHYADYIYDVTLCGALAKGILPDLPAISKMLMESVYYVKLTDVTTTELDIETLMKDNSLRGAFVRTIIGRMEKDGKDRDRYLRALLYGLRAFDGEVRINEDY